jgi:hypothetical protein
MDLLTWLRAEWDRVLGFSLIALGAVLLVLGYLGVSGSPYVAEQLSYIVSGGLGGLFLLGAGATLLILADLHDEWRKLDRVEAMLSGEIPFPTRPQTNGAASPSPSAAPAGSAALAAASAPAAAPVAAPAPAASPALMVETAPAESDGRPGPAEPRPGPTAAAVFRRERFALGAGLLLAVAVLCGSWARASGVDQPKPAIAAVAVAVFGLLLVALGAVGSTLTVKRHVQLRKARLFSPWLAPVEESVNGPSASGSLVVAPGLTRYHRADCPSVAGLAVRPVERRSLPSGLEPCRLCDPDAAG